MLRVGPAVPGRWPWYLLFDVNDLDVPIAMMNRVRAHAEADNDVGAELVGERCRDLCVVLCAEVFRRCGGAMSRQRRRDQPIAGKRSEGSAITSP
ncbi:MAG: hypothetical protein ACTHKS_17885 [Gaiellaceae bacterium]